MVRDASYWEDYATYKVEMARFSVIEKIKGTDIITEEIIRYSTFTKGLLSILK